MKEKEQENMTGRKEKMGRVCFGARRKLGKKLEGRKEKKPWKKYDGVQKKWHIENILGRGRKYRKVFGRREEKLQEKFFLQIFPSSLHSPVFLWLFSSSRIFFCTFLSPPFNILYAVFSTPHHIFSIFFSFRKNWKNYCGSEGEGEWRNRVGRRKIRKI